tara:strand:- start:336 stop:749 length:414 start_codon:yes stop_codon:yes gene_type:complete
MSLQWEHNTFVLKVSLLVLGGVTLISLISNWGRNRTKRFSKPFVKKVGILTKNTQFYYNSAQQEVQPLLRLIHANFAVAYAQTVRLLATDNEIQIIAKINMQELVLAAQKIQRMAITACHNICPVLNAPNNVGGVLN